MRGSLHDLGEVAVPMATWIKSVPLSDREQNSIRMHPHHTERVLAQSAALRQAGTVAGQHHERLNGSGYHRGFAGQRFATAFSHSGGGGGLPDQRLKQGLTEPRCRRNAPLTK